MKHKVVVMAALVLALAVNKPWDALAEEGFPAGWTAIGSHTEHYELRESNSEGAPGKPALMISAKADASDTDSAALVRDMDAAPYRGNTVRFVPDIRYRGKERGYEYWIRAYDEKGAIAYNVRAPSSPGRARVEESWMESDDLTLLIPPQAARIEIGVGVRGKGQLMMKKSEFLAITVKSSSFTTTGGIVTFSGPDPVADDLRKKMVDEQSFVYATLPVNLKWPGAATPNWRKNVDNTAHPAKSE